MSRKCVECGKMHGMVLENTQTGEVMNEIDKCYDCLWKNWQPQTLTEQVILKHDISIEELKKMMKVLEQKCIENLL